MAIQPFLISNHPVQEIYTTVFAYPDFFLQADRRTGHTVLKPVTFLPHKWHAAVEILLGEKGRKHSCIIT